jgi:hypothetical protein
MVEDNTGEYYPRETNIMFVSLPRLAEEMGLGGELSQLLLGNPVHGLSDELKPILEMFRHEYEDFKENEEVVKSMTILEEKYTEGRIERDMEIARTLFARRMDTAETLRTLKELGISDEIIEAAHKQRPISRAKHEQ